MDTNGHRSGGIQSVERAVAVLKLFGEAAPELGVTELARRLKLHKSTVSRLLSTLEAGGFVQQDPHTNRYRLGLQLATLAGLALTQYDLRDVARPLLADLASQAGETTTLSVLDGEVAVNIDEVPGSQPVKHLGRIGRRLPLHCTAAGKPLLAHLPDEVVQRLMHKPLERYTTRTIGNEAALRKELERTRAQGYSVAVEEYEIDLSAVGAAVRDHRGDVVASITISGPTFRLQPSRLPDLGILVRQTAERISARLGHRAAGASVMGAPRPPGTGTFGSSRAASARAGSGPGRSPVGLAGPVFGQS